MFAKGDGEQPLLVQSQHQKMTGKKLTKRIDRECSVG
jgi:hypothetical protein